MAARVNPFHVLHHGRKIFQQQSVDQYCVMETQWFYYFSMKIESIGKHDWKEDISQAARLL
jgi:hypothetical protein